MGSRGFRPGHLQSILLRSSYSPEIGTQGSSYSPEIGTQGSLYVPEIVTQGPRYVPEIAMLLVQQNSKERTLKLAVDGRAFSVSAWEKLSTPPRGNPP